MSQNYDELCKFMIANGMLTEEIMDFYQIPLSTYELNHNSLNKHLGSNRKALKSQRLVLINHKNRLIIQSKLPEKLKEEAKRFKAVEKKLH